MSCVVVAFTLKPFFYPTASSAVHAVSVLMLFPKEIRILLSQWDRKIKKNRELIKVGKNQMLTYRVREHNKHAYEESKNYEKCK